ncbi:epididymal-specific lipocalin-9 [Fukomys damarensis]|uniref:epididymal-specific lipocalin-9 n=1 Tax=Fukomys damarensis TaxID=885580 RepID=UPI00053F6153|nr:epididymal-specific lipocalin-9 [Fukomys damarensis]
MVLPLLVLVLSLASAQKLQPEEIVEQDFNMARVAGKWLSISLASDNVTWIGVNGDLHLFVRTIELLRNGSLVFHFRFMMQGECVFVTMVCEKTQENECSIVYQGENKVMVLETDYWIYVIFYLRNVRDSVETQVLALYGTDPGCQGHQTRLGWRRSAQPRARAGLPDTRSPGVTLSGQGGAPRPVPYASPICSQGASRSLPLLGEEEPAQP